MADRPIEDLFARLERERLEADRAYNDALTAVDRALQTVPDLPPASHADEGTQVTERGLLFASLRNFLRRFVEAAAAGQVDHLAAEHRETERTIAALFDVLRRQFAALVHFESRLIAYLQTITAYVDTKDRSIGGAELREQVALAQQRILLLQREVDRMSAGGSPTASQSSRRAAATGRPPAAFDTRLDGVEYVGFEDRFRGSQDMISERLQNYLPLFSSASDVLDVGCGRGELLELFRQRSIAARGIDTNSAMVELCRARGLDVEQSDALGYLECQADGSLGGLAAIQVVEHFEPAYLLGFLKTAYHKLRPGAPLVLETINPACWVAFFESYIRDLTHVRPVHPDTLRYLVQASGFTSIEVQYREPVREDGRMEHASLPASASGNDTALSDLVAVVNAHADKLNARLFSFMDYAVTARR